MSGDGLWLPMKAALRAAVQPLTARELAVIVATARDTTEVRNILYLQARRGHLERIAQPGSDVRYRLVESRT